MAEDYELRELAAPTPAAQAESVPVQISVGSLPKGGRLIVMTKSGKVVGALAPFPAGASRMTGTVAVPGSAIVNGRLQLRLQVEAPGVAARAPLPGEVENLKVEQPQ